MPDVTPHFMNSWSTPGNPGAGRKQRASRRGRLVVLVLCLPVLVLLGRCSGLLDTPDSDEERSSFKGGVLTVRGNQVALVRHDREGRRTTWHIGERAPLGADGRDIDLMGVAATPWPAGSSRVAFVRSLPGSADHTITLVHLADRQRFDLDLSSLSEGVAPVRLDGCLGWSPRGDWLHFRTEDGRLYLSDQLHAPVLVESRGSGGDVGCPSWVDDDVLMYDRNAGTETVLLPLWEATGQVVLPRPARLLAQWPGWAILVSEGRTYPVSLYGGPSPLHELVTLGRWPEPVAVPPGFTPPFVSGWGEVSADSLLPGTNSPDPKGTRLTWWLAQDGVTTAERKVEPVPALVPGAHVWAPDGGGVIVNEPGGPRMYDLADDRVVDLDEQQPGAPLVAVAWLP